MDMRHGLATAMIKDALSWAGSTACALAPVTPTWSTEPEPWGSKIQIEPNGAP